jgi:hypothetical protein
MTTDFLITSYELKGVALYALFIRIKCRKNVNVSTHQM